MNLQNVFSTSFLSNNLDFDDLSALFTSDTLTLLNPLFPALTNSVVRQGNAQGNVLTGLLGDDTLRGGSGPDFLFGLSGDDELFGEAGDDQIWGGFGNDLIDGGEGVNILWGGPGQDQFVIRPNGATNTIRDYQVGIDQFRLQDGLTFSQLAITQVGADTQIRYLNQPDIAVVLENTQASELSADGFLFANVTPTFDSLFIFGDSLSDPGNFFDLTGFFPPPPYADGRFSNGDIWSDYFTDSLAFETNQVFNFAIGGATTGSENTVESLLESLAGLNLPLPGLSTQIDSYLASLAGSPSNANGLYVVWAGANDFLNPPSDPAAIPGFVTSAIANVVEAISRLATDGAETFLVPNIPNLGLTPRSLDEGISAQAESLTVAFNTGLAEALDELELAVDVDIVGVDIFSTTTDIINSPGGFGLTNVVDPLIEQFPSEDQGFFWWDDIHPTTAIHRIVSDAFQAELFDAGYLLDAEAVASPAGSGAVSAGLASEQIGNSNLLTARAGDTNILQPDAWGSIIDAFQG
ncbi:MAG: SGNH/GDSL hydrolase family protein [Cyanobacteria bacterium P01_D01_bin.105]